jgi:PKD repeat protein
MKSSISKYIIFLLLFSLPLIIWALTSQRLETRQFADDGNLSLTPTATPSATPSLTPTPTNSPPHCNGLSVNPIAGSVPLTVSFACAGYDPNNDITAAEFGFGNDDKRLVEQSAGQFGSVTTTYTYTKAGSYHVTCRLRDNNQAFSDYPQYCTNTVDVRVGSPPRTPTTSTTPRPTATPTSAEKGADTPLVFLGGAQISPAPTVTPYPPAATPVPYTAPKELTQNFGQLGKIALVSIVTVIIALLLKRFIGGSN